MIKYSHYNFLEGMKMSAPDLTKAVIAAMNKDTGSGKTFPDYSNLVKFIHGFFETQPSAEDVANLSQAMKYLHETAYLVPFAAAVGGADNMNQEQRQASSDHADKFLRTVDLALVEHGHSFRHNHVVTIKEAGQIDLKMAEDVAARRRLQPPTLSPFPSI